MAVLQSRIFKNYLYSFIAWFLDGFASVLPRNSSMVVGMVIGELIAMLSRKDRERAINNIERSLQIDRCEAKNCQALLPECREKPS